MSKKTVILCKWGGAYNSLSFILDLMATEFSRYGLECKSIEVSKEGVTDQLGLILSEKNVLFALGFSGVGAFLSNAAGNNYWEVSKIPFFNWSCDHPCYYPNRHTVRNSYIVQGFVFQEHAVCHLQLGGGSGVAVHVPLGCPSVDSFNRTHLPLNERAERVIFSKSGSDTNEIERLWKMSPRTEQRILFNASDALYHADIGSATDVIISIAAQHGIYLEANNLFTQYIVREVDNYIRFKRANDTVRWLVDFPVDVFGSGWDHLATETNSNLRLMGPSTASEIHNKLPLYTASLSLQPFVSKGLHDRTYWALACNVIPIQNKTTFLSSNMPMLEKYSFDFYSDSVRSAMGTALENPELSLLATESARQAITDTGSLKFAAERIIEASTYVSLNSRI